MSNDSTPPIAGNTKSANKSTALHELQHAVQQREGFARGGNPGMFEMRYNTAPERLKDANYSAELHYFYYPESIVTASTSWVGTNFSSCLLYTSDAADE